jgi:hypothetical protein
VTETSAAASHDLKRRGLKLPPQALPWLPRPPHKMREEIAGLPAGRRRLSRQGLGGKDLPMKIEIVDANGATSAA